MNTQPEQQKTLITKRELKAMLTVKSDTTIRNFELSDPTFPKKIKIGNHRVAYRLEDVQSWIKSNEVIEEASNANTAH